MILLAEAGKDGCCVKWGKVLEWDRFVGLPSSRDTLSLRPFDKRKCSARLVEWREVREARVCVKLENKMIALRSNIVDKARILGKEAKLNMLI